MANLGSNDTAVTGDDFSLPAGAQLDEESGDLVIRDSGGNVVFRRDEAVGEWVLDNFNANEVDTDSLVIGGTIYQEDGNSPIDVNTTSHTYTVAGDWDEIVVLPRATNLGFDQLQVNGDTGANYTYIDTADTETTGQNQWDLEYSVTWNRLLIRDDRNNRLRFRTDPNGGGAGKVYRGQNDNVQGPISQLTFSNSGGTDQSFFARVYGRDVTDGGSGNL